MEGGAGFPIGHAAPSRWGGGGLPRAAFRFGKKVFPFLTFVLLFGFACSEKRPQFWRNCLVLSPLFVFSWRGGLEGFSSFLIGGGRRICFFCFCCCLSHCALFCCSRVFCEPAFVLSLFFFLLAGGPFLESNSGAVL